VTVYELSSAVPATAEQLFDWHARPGAFERLDPPWAPVTVLAREGRGIDVGVTLTIRVPGSPGIWVTRHTACTRPSGFVDELVKGPVASWKHEHRFADQRLTDHIEIRPYLGVGGGFVVGRLDPVFRFRHARTRLDLQRHGAFADRPRLRVAITGASGLLGRELAGFLETGGHEVLRISRSGPIRWDPDRGEIDRAALEGLDAVVHLAGEPISARWTDERKRRMRSSRVGSTELLVRTFASLDRKPRAFLSGSAVGLYGDRGDEDLSEESEPGEGFLAEVCKAWEAAARPARDLGIRTALLRTGLVLSARGGLLQTLAAVTRAGGGGPIGSGANWQPWIAVDDWVGAVHALLWDEGAEGPFDLVAPEPVRQRELAHAIGRVLRRPTLLTTPAAAVRLAMGAEMADEIALSGQRARPNRLLARGFRFDHADLEGALRFELGRLG
jgi:hypothetical protein